MISSYMIEDEPILNDEYIEAIPLGHPFDYSVYFTAIVNDNRKMKPLYYDLLII